MSHQTLLTIFVVCFLLEFAAFGMQRATLLMSGEANVPHQIGAMLLPSWFPIVWLARIGKWGVLFAVAVIWSWASQLRIRRLVPSRSTGRTLLHPAHNSSR